MISPRLKSLARRAASCLERLTTLAEIAKPQRDLKLLLPSLLFVVAGDTLDMFTQRMTRYGRHLRRSVVGHFPGGGSTGSCCGRLASPAIHFSGPAQIQFEGSNLTHQVSIRAASPTISASPRILCIGDSLSWQGTLSALNARLITSRMEPEFIGTYREIGGLASEARSSWQAANFTGHLAGVNADGSGAIYPIDRKRGDGKIRTTDEYLELAEDPAVYGERWQYNPFIRRATVSDDASVIRSGFVFDLSFYLHRFGFAKPDIVFIALGTNDVRSQPMGTGAMQAVDALGIIHKQIRLALPHGKIGFMLNGFGRSALWARMCPLIDQMLLRYSGADADGTFVLPAYLAVDPVDGYRATAVDHQCHAAHPAMKVDETHMGEIGRQQWANVMYAFVVNNTAVDRSAPIVSLAPSSNA